MTRSRVSVVVNEEIMRVKSKRSLFYKLSGALFLFGLSGTVLAEGTAVKTLDDDLQAHKDCAGCHVAINPGISFSAISISRRPQSARPM